MNVYIHESMKSMFANVTDNEGLVDAITRTLFTALVVELKELSLKNHDLVDDEIKQKLSSKEEINQIIHQTYYYLWLALRNDRAVINDNFTLEEAIKSVGIAIINIIHILSNDELKSKVDSAFAEYDCSSSKLEEILQVATAELEGLKTLM